MLLSDHIATLKNNGHFVLFLDINEISQTGALIPASSSSSLFPILTKFSPAQDLYCEGHLSSPSAGITGMWGPNQLNYSLKGYKTSWGNQINIMYNKHLSNSEPFFVACILCPH